MVTCCYNRIQQIHKYETSNAYHKRSAPRRKATMISALTELLSNYYLSGDLTQVEMIARTIRAVIPDDIIALQILGLAYLQRGRTSDALKLFQEADRKDVQTPEIKSSGDGSSEPQIELAASALYREATRKHSGFGKLWYDLGAALIALKRPKQSIWALRTALVARPAFPDALMALGSAGLEVGDQAAAREGFSGLLAIQPDNVIARSGLAHMNRPGIS